MKDNPIIQISALGTDIIPDKKTALRFMGCKNSNEEADSFYNSCLSDFMKEASYKAVYRKTGVTFFGEKGISFDFCEIESESLRKNLEGCKSAFVFAATAGSAVDRLILRQTKISAGRAMIVDAIASSGIESFCDEINEKMREGRVLKPRFSPGYGDVSLSCQSSLLSFLEAYKKIGLALTETNFMTPAKSVTAIVGISEDKEC